MSSAGAARLSQILKTSKPSTTPRILASSTPSPPTIVNPKPQPQPLLSVKDLINEPNVEQLAKNFKQRATESLTFRDRHNIYDFTINRLAQAKRFSLIEDILESHKHFQEITHEGFAIRLIALYGKAGMFDHARKVFDEMPELNCTRTVKSLNALMKAGVVSKNYDEVCKIFRDLPSGLSVSLNCVSYNIIVHCYCEMGLVDEALLMVEEMKGNELTPNVITFNTILDGFYRDKGFEEGEKIWDMMMVEYKVVRNTRSYNLRMQAMVNLGEIDKAVDLFETLVEQGLKPDVNTFNVLIKGFKDRGHRGEAKRWYNLLLESEEKPNRNTFSMIVSTFCEDGDCELAYELCKNMFNRQFVVDETLLQLVVDALVKGSMIEEAKEIVDLGKSNSYVQYNLVLPMDNLVGNGSASD